MLKKRMLKKFSQAMLASSALFVVCGPLQSVVQLVLVGWLPSMIVTVGLRLALFYLNTSSTIDLVVFSIFMKGFRDEVKKLFGVSPNTSANM